ncbi:unnamed protein product [Withania somnifera]
MNCFRAPALIISIMVFSISLDLVFSQTTSSLKKGGLDINISSSSQDACTTLDSNWHGFMDCLTLMNNNSSDKFSCCIKKLTSGAGGCSDYSEIDIMNKLGRRLKSLRDDCRLMDSEGGLTKSCNQCLRTWRAIAASKNDSTKLEDDIRRFSMLILLTSQRVSDETSSAYESGSETRRRIKLKRDLWILIGGVAGMVVIIIVALWILLKRKTEVKPSCRRYSKISHKEIYSGTNSLSMSNFIGQGVAVYTGILADRQDVAIKHIIKDEQMETFVREVTSLSHIKHPNLVSLLRHHDGPNECFLVYELCHNRNLSKWLFASKVKYLSWRRRLEIAFDSYSQGSIVHRDIKPANILLSANFEAQLSDFGLSKIISIGHSYASSEVRGTFGYIDPDFGIVLLQLLSGQRVINLDLKNPMPLSKMAFELVLKLALTSIGLTQQRPSMEQVVIELEEALDLSTRVESVHR